MKAIHNYVSYEPAQSGGFRLVKIVTPREVTVMVIIDKYAMVRVNGGTPIVVKTSELEFK